METTTTQTEEIVDWVKTLKDKETIADLLEMKRRATFNFEEAMKNGIPLEEARRRSIEKIRSYSKK
jgi:LDH2 family malate/lactate/ureidoglycolate dehydrogenase